MVKHSERFVTLSRHVLLITLLLQDVEVSFARFRVISPNLPVAKIT